MNGRLPSLRRIRKPRSSRHPQTPFEIAHSSCVLKARVCLGFDQLVRSVARQSLRVWSVKDSRIPRPPGHPHSLQGTPHSLQGRDTFVTRVRWSVLDVEYCHLHAEACCTVGTSNAFGGDQRAPEGVVCHRDVAEHLRDVSALVVCHKAQMLRVPHLSLRLPPCAA